MTETTKSMIGEIVDSLVKMDVGTLEKLEYYIRGYLAANAEMERAIKAKTEAPTAAGDENTDAE